MSNRCEHRCDRLEAKSRNGHVGVLCGQGQMERSMCTHSVCWSLPQGGGLQLSGPAICHNQLITLKEQSFTPTSYHEHWVRSAEIPRGDRSTYEHECLARILESLICLDQLNVPALQGAELICRRMLVIREAHRLSPASPDYSSADHYMGWKYRRSGQNVDVDLASHVATELKNEAAIAKEARKAREEQALRRGRPNPKKQGEGGKDP